MQNITRCHELTDLMEEAKHGDRKVFGALMLEFLECLSEELDQLGEEIDEISNR